MDSSWFVDCFHSNRQRFESFTTLYFLPFSLYIFFLVLFTLFSQCNLNIKYHQVYCTVLRCKYDNEKTILMHLNWTILSFGLLSSVYVLNLFLLNWERTDSLSSFFIFFSTKIEVWEKCYWTEFRRQFFVFRLKIVI